MNTKTATVTPSPAQNVRAIFDRLEMAYTQEGDSLTVEIGTAPAEPKDRAEYYAALNPSRRFAYDEFGISLHSGSQWVPFQMRTILDDGKTWAEPSPYAVPVSNDEYQARQTEVKL